MPNDVQSYVYAIHEILFSSVVFFFSSLNLWLFHFVCASIHTWFGLLCISCVFHSLWHEAIWCLTTTKRISSDQKKSTHGNLYSLLSGMVVCCISLILSIVLGDSFFFSSSSSLSCQLSPFDVDGRSLFTWKFSRFKRRSAYYNTYGIYWLATNARMCAVS